MAKNLRAKLPDSDTLTIHDFDPAVSSRFVDEVKASSGKHVEIAEKGRHAADKSVRQFPYLKIPAQHPDDLFYR